MCSKTVLSLRLQMRLFTGAVVWYMVVTWAQTKAEKRAWTNSTFMVYIDVCVDFFLIIMLILLVSDGHIQHCILVNCTCCASQTQDRARTLYRSRDWAVKFESSLWANSTLFLKPVPSKGCWDLYFRMESVRDTWRELGPDQSLTHIEKASCHWCGI